MYLSNNNNNNNPDDKIYLILEAKYIYFDYFYDVYNYPGHNIFFKVYLSFYL